MLCARPPSLCRDCQRAAIRRKCTPAPCHRTSTSPIQTREWSCSQRSWDSPSDISAEIRELHELYEFGKRSESSCMLRPGLFASATFLDYCTANLSWAN